MITMTQDQHIFENRVEHGVVSGLFEIRKVTKKTDITPTSVGIALTDEMVVFPCSDYVYVDKDRQISNGDIKPYGVIILARRFACILYDLALASQYGGSAITTTGFVVLSDTEAGDSAINYARIMPTRYLSNMYAKLTGMVPSGAVAMSDRVLCSYPGATTFSAVDADHIVYDGIMPVAAFDVHECIAPTLVMKASGYDDAWYRTVVEIIKRGTYFGNVPAVSGFVTTDYSTSMLTQLVAQLKTFSTLTGISNFLLSRKPASSATSLEGVIKSVVDESALVDQSVVDNIASGILLETQFCALLDSRDFSKLSVFGIGGAYMYYTLNDDFSALINKFNDKYLEISSKIVRITYSQLVTFVNLTREALDEMWTQAYASGMLDTFISTVSDYDDSLRDNFFGQYLNTMKTVFPRIFAIDTTLLKKMRVSTPAFLTLVANRENDEAMLEEIKSKMKYFITPDFSKMVQDYTDGKYPDLPKHLQTAIGDSIDRPVINGKELYGTKSIMQALHDTCVKKGQEDALSTLKTALDAVCTTATANANVDAVKAATSDRFWGWYIAKWFAGRWHQEPSYYDVEPSRNYLCKMEVVINPTLKKAQHTFVVLSGIIGGYYDRQNMSYVAQQNAAILSGALPPDWTVSNEGHVGTALSSVPSSWHPAKYCTRARFTQHIIRSPWFDISTIALPDPVLTLSASAQAQVGELLHNAFSGVAAGIAYAFIEPMLTSISAVAEYSAIAYVGGAHVRLDDVCKIASLRSAYIDALGLAVETVQKVLINTGREKEALKLTQFVSNLATALELSKRPPFYYLTAAGYKLGERYTDPAAPAIALLYAGGPTV